MEKVTQNPLWHIALHWDGKHAKTRLSKYKALAAIAYKNRMFLGKTMLDSPTGKAQAEASHDMLQIWKIADNMRALVFDTTSSNNGWKSGAAKLLQEKLGRKVFYNACKHHIYELVGGALCKAMFGKETTGPEMTMFNEFKSDWDKIDKQISFQTLRFFDLWLENKAKVVVKEITELLALESIPKVHNYAEITSNVLN